MEKRCLICIPCTFNCHDVIVKLYVLQLWQKDLSLFRQEGGGKWHCCVLWHLASNTNEVVLWHNTAVLCMERHQSTDELPVIHLSSFYDSLNKISLKKVDQWALSFHGSFSLARIRLTSTWNRPLHGLNGSIFLLLIVSLLSTDAFRASLNVYAADISEASTWKLLGTDNKGRQEVGYVESDRRQKSPVSDVGWQKL